MNLEFRIKKGFTFIDVIIGISLMLIVFLGIFGAFQLGMKVVRQSQAKITVTALANQQIEQVRNLPYESVGVKGEYPDGVLEAATTTVSNNIEYLIETRVDFVIDSADGIASPEDDCPNDYKRVEVKVSWPGRFGGKVTLVTDVAPENLSQECAIAGGILSVSVFDAYGVMVFSPLIELKDPETDEILKIATPSEGKHYFSLAASTYKVVVSKSGYSGERTYGTNEIATPEKPHPMVLEGQLTKISFSIDKTSTFSVTTTNQRGLLDGTALDPPIEEGEPSGAFYFEVIKEIRERYPTSHLEDRRQEILNRIGVLETEIVQRQAEGLPTDSQERELAILQVLLDALDQYLSEGILGIVIPNVIFLLQGAKIIGTDAEENPVYKYSQNHTSNSNGRVDIPNLEWDSYTFSVDPDTDLDLMDTDPSPQPISLSPDTTLPVILYLEAENSLLITIQDIETLEPVFAAEVRLYNIGLGYDTIQYADEKGQTYFIPLGTATYDLEVGAPGYATTSATIWVSGDVTKTITLEQAE